jgi:phosphate transport system protein
MPSRPPTDADYEAELRSLRQALIRMAGRVEEMIRAATQAYVDRDGQALAKVIEHDRKVNQSEIDIDEMCLALIANRRPEDAELRFITAAFKMVTDLERIGDLAVNVCERAAQLALLPMPIPGFAAEIPRVGALVQQMVHDAINALIEADSALAQDVVKRDDEVDDLYHQIFRAVLARMIEDPDLVERGIHVQSVAKFLERIGDHATNLAEAVVLMVAGQDIRHSGKL